MKIIFERKDYKTRRQPWQRPENEGQRNIQALFDKVCAPGVGKWDQRDHDFLIAVYNAWAGYTDDQYSYPAHQLHAIEERFGTTLKEVTSKYENSKH